ncbi:MAG: cyclic nucleotide-binding domain-containing protein [Halofilum sp. (in: g-proteobacteria)]|nr:cyclic nucleotide-binding domain-containing protein [Halofilum sp. (in: g-proteobacteria)]
MKTATVEKYAAGEEIFHEGDAGDCLQLIRRGSVTISRDIGGRDIVLAYVPAGQYVGEMALVSDAPRSATVRAAVSTETVRLDGDVFKKLMEQHPDVRRRVQEVYKERLTSDMDRGQQPEAGDIISFLVEQAHRARRPTCC